MVVDIARKEPLNQPEEGSFHQSPAEKALDIFSGVQVGKNPEDRSDAFFKAIEKLYDGKNLHFITELSENDINNLIRIREMWIWSDKKVDILMHIFHWKMKLRVSKRRKGRFEFFDTFKSRMLSEDMQNQQSGFFSRMAGRGNGDTRR